MTDYKNIVEEIIASNPCLNCKNPRCVAACPINQSIPTFIDLLKKKEYSLAYQTILNKSYLPSLCGLLCPHEKQCEGHCVKGIKNEPVSIGKLEAITASMFDNRIKKVNDSLSKYSFAVIGGGIAGITAAFELASFGGIVSIYEKNNSIGGAVKQSIPNFRFDDEVIDKLYANLKELGVKVYYNQEFGINLKIENLTSFDYVLFGLGTMIEKSNFGFSPGVYTGCSILNEYKKTGNLPEGKTCLVIGAGNVAMDVSRAFARSGYETMIVYRRTLKLSPALKKEIEDAKSDGVKFLELANPIEPVYNNQKLVGLKIENMNLSSELDSSGRSKIVSTGNTNIIPTDLIIEAIGSLPDYNYFLKLKFPIFENGWIKQNDEMSFANFNNYYFIGDFVNGPTTVVNAMKSSMQAVDDIKRKLKVK